MIPSDDRLEELFVQYWDNTLTPSEAEELERRLAAVRSAQLFPVVHNAGSRGGGIAPFDAARNRTRKNRGIHVSV